MGTYTHTHTNQGVVSVWLQAPLQPEVGATTVASWCRSLSMISNNRRDSLIMAGGALDYSTTARPLRGGKGEGETTTGECSSSSTVSLSIYWNQKQTNRGYSCTRQLTCFTKGFSERVCECHNLVRTCTGCMFWGKCRNKVWLLPSPTTARGVLGNLARDAVRPASSPCV